MHEYDEPVKNNNNDDSNDLKGRKYVYDDGVPPCVQTRAALK